MKTHGKNAIIYNKNNMNIDSLKFFLSTEQKCSYLDDRTSASIFADPEGEMSTALYSVLINHGFRRSANYVYRPHCPSCKACKPTRVPVQLFTASRNQKRVWKKNQDVNVTEAKPEYNNEHFELYKKYIRYRHQNGDMDHDDPKRYFEFLDSDWCDTTFYEFRLEEKLVAVAATDLLTQGLSALYTFFDPELEKRSLGTYAILWQIKQAESLHKPYLYLGYWIKDCQKMQYKNKFKPLEIWDEEKWRDQK